MIKGSGYWFFITSNFNGISICF